MASIYVDVDIEEHLDEVSTEDLIEELKTRKDAKEAQEALAESPLHVDLIEEAIENIRAGALTDAVVVLERLLRPKFKSPNDCLRLLAKMKGEINGTSHA